MNSKALEAKAKRDAIKQDADSKKQKAIEDEYWKDDDKNIAKKQKRKASFLKLFNNSNLNVTELWFVYKCLVSCKQN